MNDSTADSIYASCQSYAQQLQRQHRAFGVYSWTATLLYNLLPDVRQQPDLLYNQSRRTVAEGVTVDIVNYKVAKVYVSCCSHSQ